MAWDVYSDYLASGQLPRIEHVQELRAALAERLAAAAVTISPDTGRHAAIDASRLYTHRTAFTHGAGDYNLKSLRDWCSIVAQGQWALRAYYASRSEPFARWSPPETDPTGPNPYDGDAPHYYRGGPDLDFLGDLLGYPAQDVFAGVRTHSYDSRYWNLIRATIRESTDQILRVTPKFERQVKNTSGHASWSDAAQAFLTEPDGSWVETLDLPLVTGALFDGEYSISATRVRLTLDIPSHHPWDRGAQLAVLGPAYAGAGSELQLSAINVGVGSDSVFIPEEVPRNQGKTYLTSHTLAPGEREIIIEPVAWDDAAELSKYEPGSDDTRKRMIFLDLMSGGQGVTRALAFQLDWDYA